MLKLIFKVRLLVAGPARRSRYANRTWPRICHGVVGLLCFGAVSDFAQDESELTKQAQDPLARLISVPFQNNFNFGVGPNEASQYVLNLQPVISLRVNDNWNLITRTIVPIERQPQLAPGLPDRATGLDDTQLSLFLSPAGVGNLLWGVGPILRLPTAGNDSLGAGKFSIGPAAVIAREGHWVAGALIRRRGRESNPRRQRAGKHASPDVQRCSTPARRSGVVNQVHRATAAPERT
jgi:hypothetical protein